MELNNMKSATIVNVEEGTIKIRELTKEESNQLGKDKLELEIQETNERNKRNALLEKLGITEEEAKLLLGGN
jgi:hypothetical protein